MEKIIEKVEARMIHDEDNNVFTVFRENDKGGAIVSDADPFKAMEKFKEGMLLAFAVKNLMNFVNKTGKWYMPEFI